MLTPPSSPRAMKQGGRRSHRPHPRGHAPPGGRATFRYRLTSVIRAVDDVARVTAHARPRSEHRGEDGGTLSRCRGVRLEAPVKPSYSDDGSVDQLRYDNQCFREDVFDGDRIRALTD